VANQRRAQVTPARKGDESSAGVTFDCQASAPIGDCHLLKPPRPPSATAATLPAGSLDVTVRMTVSMAVGMAMAVPSAGPF